jgi:hypothetical protein
MKRISVCVVSTVPARAADLETTWEELGVISRVITPDQVAAADPARYELLWLVAAPEPHPAEMAAEWGRAARLFLYAGKGVYGEFVRGFPSVPGQGRLRKPGPARLFVADALDGALPAGRILDAHDALTLDMGAALGRLLAGFGAVRGVRSVLTPAAEVWPGIVTGETGSGRWAWAAFRMSDYRRRQFSAQADWGAFVTELARWLLPGEARRGVGARRIPMEAYVQPRAWSLPGTLRLVVNTAAGARVTAPGAAFREEEPGRFVAEAQRTRPGEARFRVRVARGGRARAADLRVRVEGRQEAWRRALIRNIAWFERSGVMPAPDGSLGVTEWISGPDGEGNRIPYGKGQLFAPDRADCVFESGLAFLLHGRAAESPRHARIGRQLLQRALDFQRLEAGDQYYGLWFTRGRSGPPYEDDQAWAVICALAAYRLTGEKQLLERGMLAAGRTLEIYGERSPAAAAAVDPGMEHPHDRGQMLAAWFYAYAVSGDTSFLDAAVPGLHRLMGTFKRSRHPVISRTGELSRLLLPLSLGFACTRDTWFSDELAAAAASLRARRAACGAIQEDAGSAGDRLDGTDLGLTYLGTEPVSDQLYTTSWAAMNLLIAHQATGDAAYREDFETLMDYLVRIQVDRPGDPRVDGGWTRAFDYELWEAHASNADHSWTAWCMETGWTNAVIDIALALALLENDLFTAAETRR